MLAQSLATPNFGFLISQTNTSTAKALENYQAVCSAPRIRAHGLDEVFYPGVLRDVGKINDTYAALFRKTAGAATKLNLTQMHRTWSRMLLPSSSLANFSLSLRSEVAPEPESANLAHPPLLPPEAPQESLNRLLADLDPDLVDRRKGSWQTFRSSNPDRLSQAASSYRELIRTVLDKLAPGVDTDRSIPGSKRKRQARQILGGSEGEFAGALAEALANLYAVLSKVVHTPYRNELAVQAALVSGDGLLLFLLSSRSGGS